MTKEINVPCGLVGDVLDVVIQHISIGRSVYYILAMNQQINALEPTTILSSPVLGSYATKRNKVVKWN